MSDLILGVDVDAEIVKLSLGRLESRAQIPLALARLAAAAGAQTIRIMLGRRRMELWHDGRMLERETIELLATALDRRRGEWERHRALGRLEILGMLDLLVAFAQPDARTTIELGEPLGLSIERLNQGGLRIEQRKDLGGTHILVRGRRPHSGREIDELKNSLEHARYRVFLNGRRIDHGPRLVEQIIEMHYSDERFSALVGIPCSGLVATTRICENGVLQKTFCTSPPDGLVYEALVEASAGCDRRAALGFAHRSAADLFKRAAGKIEEFAPADRARVKSLLFRMVARGSGFDILEGARLFTTCQAESQSLEDLRGSALGRIVRAVAPGARLELFDLDAGKVFVLDEVERAFVEKSLGLLVREPARRPVERAIVKLWRHWREKAGLGVERIAKLLAGKQLARERLGAREREFLERLDGLLETGLAPQLGAERAEFGSGRFGTARLIEDHGRKLLLLSLANPAVRRMVKAQSHDRRTLYAALVALAGGKDAFGPERERAVNYFLEISQGGHAH